MAATESLSSSSTAVAAAEKVPCDFLISQKLMTAYDHNFSAKHERTRKPQEYQELDMRQIVRVILCSLRWCLQGSSLPMPQTATQSNGVFSATPPKPSNIPEVVWQHLIYDITPIEHLCTPKGCQQKCNEYQQHSTTFPYSESAQRISKLQRQLSAPVPGRMMFVFSSNSSASSTASLSRKLGKAHGRDRQQNGEIIWRFPEMGVPPSHPF